MADQENSQRRRNHRLSIDIPVKIRFNGITVPGKSANLSCGGIFVHTPDPLPEEGQFDLELPLPDGSGPLKISSELVWQHPVSKESEEAFPDQDEDQIQDRGDEEGEEEAVMDLDSPADEADNGSGFKFQSLSPEEKERITQFIKRLMRQDTH